MFYNPLAMLSPTSRPLASPPASAGAPQTLAALLLLLLLAVLAVVALLRDPGRAAGPAMSASAALSAGPAVAAGGSLADTGIPPAEHPVPPARTAERMLAEVEVPYGPFLAGWSTAEFVRERGGALAGYTESVGGETLSGAELVERVAQEHSLSPALLLALLEEATGAVEDPAAAARLGRPFGASLAGPGLNAGLRSAAAWLDDGFYGLLHRDTSTLHFRDGSQQPGPLDAGAGHFAVARLLAMSSTPDTLPTRLAAFAATYRRLFGDPPAAADRLPPPPEQPPLLLPWPEGERWHFTGGPHGAWGVATAWSAVDFAPPSNVGCSAAPEWVVAAAPGVVTRSERGLVAVDLDGDGYEGSGWVLLYLHMATDGRVPSGTVLAAGDRIGHPSCEGGRSTGAHLHLARKHDGRWLPAAGGPAPLDLSGWAFQGGSREYDGAMSHINGERRNAVTSGRGGPSDVVSDNGPARQAQLAPAWQALARGLPAASPATAAGVAVADSTAPPASLQAILNPNLGHRPAPVAAPAAVDLAASISPSAVSFEPPLPGATDQEGPTEPGELVVNLTWTDRRSLETPFSVAIQDAAGDAQPLIGRTDALGRGDPLALPGVAPGHYTVVVRVPGFQPQSLHRVALGQGRTVVELGGRLVPLLAGELNQDDVVDARDAAAWFGHATRHRPEADVNGDGRVTAGDLALVLRSVVR